MIRTSPGGHSNVIKSFKSINFCHIYPLPI
jgi:hypothetical protein